VTGVPTVGAKRREMIPLPPVSHAEQPSLPGFPEPAVLIEAPMLGSAPGSLPDVRGVAPDTVLDGGEVAGLHVRAASVRGDAHRFDGMTRQDSLGFWKAEVDGVSVLVACVADGVGSQPLSHVGSALACHDLRSAIAAELTAAGVDLEAAARAAIARVAAGLLDLAARDDADPDTFATTLTFAVVTPGEITRAVVARVGDSSAFTLGEPGWQPCFAESEDEDGVFSSRVDALPRHADAVQVTTVDLASGELLLLCTDGLTGPLRSAQVRDALAGWWGAGRVPDLPAFLWQVSFRAKSFSDDRTALCVWAG
jgi:serine/threonine protein phosphatase PrpC